MTSKLDADRLLDFYRDMLRIRLAEERIGELSEAKKFQTPVHLCIGQEAVAVGVCRALQTEDYAFGAHRSHGHYLAKGGDLRAMIAEIYGRKTGCSLGRGGSMHLCAPEVGMMGTVPIVSATIPIAVGGALASKLRGEKRVSVSFFGDGAMEEGPFHESMNLAAVYRLPVLFVCENNLYSSHLHLQERRAKDNLIDAAQAHGMVGERIDGNDVVAVYEATRRAAGRAREGEGPTFLECRTFRWRGHVGAAWDIDVGVKRKDELKEWMEKDPLKSALRHLGSMPDLRTKLDKIEKEIRAEIDLAVDAAERAPFPDPQDLGDYVFVGEGGR